jgi:nucleotide-binding universal stress UspA family protein
MDPARSTAFSSALLTREMKRIQDRVAGLARPSGESSVDGRTGSATAVAVPSVEESVRVIPGEPAKVLLDQVRRKRASWILLGAHRKREILDFGNTLRAVFVKATVPVWVQPHPPRAIQLILVPVDFSVDSLAALALACSLAKIVHARVLALHCFSLGAYAASGSGEYTAWMDFPFDEVRLSERGRFDREMGSFRWGGVDHAAEFVDGVAAETILERAGEADLVVLGTHGKTGLTSAVLGRTAYAVLKRSPTAVLAVPRRRRFLL